MTEVCHLEFSHHSFLRALLDRSREKLLLYIIFVNTGKIKHFFTFNSMSHFFTQNYLMSVFSHNSTLWPRKALVIQHFFKKYSSTTVSKIFFDANYLLFWNHNADILLILSQVLKEAFRWQPGLTFFLHNILKWFTDWNINGLQLYDTRDTTTFTTHDVWHTYHNCYLANNMKASNNKSGLIPVSEMFKSWRSIITGWNMALSYLRKTFQLKK